MAGTAGAAELVSPDLRLPLPTGVALTLDACGGETDWRILDTLVELQVPATIFATALWLDGNAAALRVLRAHPALFQVENHGARHLPPVLGTHPVYGLRPAGTLEAIRTEIEHGGAAVAAATGRAPRWYRGATALYSPAAFGIASSLGFTVAGFSVNGDMGASLPAARVAARVGGAPDGAVIISHVNQPHRDSGAGVVAGITALRRRGARFVRLDEAFPAPVG
ncbi:MAG: polysaccharide deacetylase family protein [Rhodospirillales bacterium]|nr:polysaccharide deacetylase family protein [Rhodospirillales bacterium]